jgi:hypothetical protein
MKKYIVIPITVLVVALTASALLTNQPSVLAIDNVIQPTSEEALMNFDCSALPCKILGIRTNDRGIEINEVWYEFSIQSTKINNLNNIGFVVNKGDRVFLTATNQDQSNYFVFLPQLDIAHQFVENQSVSLILETKDIPRGDYQIILQGSLEPETADANFAAGALRIK